MVSLVSGFSGAGTGNGQQPASEQYEPQHSVRGSWFIFISPIASLIKNSIHPAAFRNGGKTAGQIYPLSHGIGGVDMAWVKYFNG